MPPSQALRQLEMQPWLVSHILTRVVLRIHQNIHLCHILYFTLSLLALSNFFKLILLRKSHLQSWVQTPIVIQGFNFGFYLLSLVHFFAWRLDSPFDECAGYWASHTGIMVWYILSRRIHGGKRFHYYVATSQSHEFHKSQPLSLPLLLSTPISGVVFFSHWPSSWRLCGWPLCFAWGWTCKPPPTYGTSWIFGSHAGTLYEGTLCEASELFL